MFNKPTQQDLYENCFENYCADCKVCVTKSQWEYHLQSMHSGVTKTLSSTGGVINRRVPLKIIPEVIQRYDYKQPASCCKDKQTQRINLPTYDQIHTYFTEGQNCSLGSRIVVNSVFVIMMLLLAILVFLGVCQLLLWCLPNVIYCFGLAWAMIVESVAEVGKMFGLLKVSWQNGVGNQVPPQNAPQQQVQQQNIPNYQMPIWDYAQFDTALQAEFTSTFTTLNTVHHTKYQKPLECGTAAACITALRLNQEIAAFQNKPNVDYLKAYGLIQRKLQWCEDVIKKMINGSQAEVTTAKLTKKLSSCEIFA